MLLNFTQLGQTSQYWLKKLNSVILVNSVNSVTYRKTASDGKASGGRSFVADRSEITGEIVKRLWRIVHQLDNQIFREINRYRGQSFPWLRIHRQYPASTSAATEIQVILLLRLRRLRRSVLYCSKWSAGAGSVWIGENWTLIISRQAALDSH